MPYYRPCPNCGCNLDPGEVCDCRKKDEAAPLQRERPQRDKHRYSLSANPRIVKNGWRYG